MFTGCLFYICNPTFPNFWSTIVFYCLKKIYFHSLVIFSLDQFFDKIASFPVNIHNNDWFIKVCIHCIVNDGQYAMQLSYGAIGSLA